MGQKERHLNQALLGLSVRLGVGLELRLHFSSFVCKEESQVSVSLAQFPRNPS